MSNLIRSSSFLLENRINTILQIIIAIIIVIIVIVYYSKTYDFPVFVEV